EHDSFLRIVRLEPLNGGGVRELPRVKQLRECVLVRVGAVEHDRERHGEVRCQRERAAIHGDGLRRERIFEGENAAPTLKMRDRGYTVEDARRSELLGSVLLLPFDGDDRGADPVTGGALSHPTAVN